MVRMIPLTARPGSTSWGLASRKLGPARAGPSAIAWT